MSNFNQILTHWAIFVQTSVRSAMCIRHTQDMRPCVVEIVLPPWEAKGVVCHMTFNKGNGFLQPT